MLKKTLFILAILIIAILPAISFGASESFCREVPLPNILGLPDNFKGPCSGIAEYIIYWFYFAINLAGLLAFLAVVTGGVMRLFSMGQPSIIQRSNKIMTNAMLGVILLFGSYLILNIINPSLTSIKNPYLLGLETNNIIKNINATPNPAMVGQNVYFTSETIANINNEYEILWWRWLINDSNGKTNIICQGYKSKNKCLNPVYIFKNEGKYIIQNEIAWSKQKGFEVKSKEMEVIVGPNICLSYYPDKEQECKDNKLCEAKYSYLNLFLSKKYKSCELLPN